MGESFQFLDILLFALIAAFLVLRLRSVLGRRTGHRGSNRDLPSTSQREAGKDTVVSIPGAGGEESLEGAEPANGADRGAQSPLQAGLTQIRIAQPNFSAEEFMSGARIAFELIVSAYAKGDREALKPFLSPEVFGNFEQSIKAREATGEALETEVAGMRAAEIVEAYMAGRTAHLTVKFVSEQITVVRDAAGNVVEGEPNAVNEVVDFWTFARDTRSPDPNWTLVATGAPE
jgi:predicted lipid-binding transport protein (Tim44 family)